MPPPRAMTFARRRLTFCPRDRSSSINLGFPVCKGDLLEYVLKRRALPEHDASQCARHIIAAVSHLHACNTSIYYTLSPSFYFFLSYP